MCGRFTQTQSAKRIAQHFALHDLPPLEPRYNIAPTQPIPAVLQQGGDRHFTYLRWGLIPPWAKDLKMGARMINARSETAAEKPSFRHALRQRRCLIVADGFYEWKRTPTGKQPHFFYLPDPQASEAGARQPFAFAGLWERWESPDGDWIVSGTILTTAANPLLRPFHERMPVILRTESYDQWLDPGQSVTQVTPLLNPFAAAAMATYPVDPQVNSSQQDHLEILKRLP